MRLPELRRAGRLREQGGDGVMWWDDYDALDYLEGRCMDYAEEDGKQCYEEGEEA